MFHLIFYIVFDNTRPNGVRNRNIDKFSRRPNEEEKLSTMYIDIALLDKDNL